MPISVGKPLDWVFETKRLSAEIIAKVNPIFDLNKDKRLTISEVEKVMLSKIPAQWQTYFKESSKRIKKKIQEPTSIVTVGVIVIAVIGSVWLYKRGKNGQNN